MRSTLVGGAHRGESVGYAAGKKSAASLSNRLQREVEFFNLHVVLTTGQ